MSDSSENNGADFADLSISNMGVMLQCLSELELLEVEVLEQTYSRHATGFDNLLDFLLRCGLVSRADSRLTLEPPLSRALADLRSAAEPRRVVQALCLDALLNGSSDYCYAVSAFLARFKTVQGVARYVPDTRERIAVAPIRNFLMDLELVTLDQADESYLLQTERIVDRTPVNVGLSPLVLEAINKAQVRIGLEAEKLVVELERIRLAQVAGLGDRIVHVSQSVVNAGYDIESCEVTRDASGNFAPRYIEVKTHRNGCTEFYWSANEIDTARRFRAKYWLYIVPRNSSGAFDASGVERVQDPVRLFEDRHEWEITPDTYKFRRKD